MFCDNADTLMGTRLKDSDCLVAVTTMASSESAPAAPWSVSAARTAAQHIDADMKPTPVPNTTVFLFM